MSRKRTATISRRPRKSVTTDPKIVESAARLFLESQGKPCFTHFVVGKKQGGESIIRLLSESVGEAKKLNDPLKPEDISYLLPWIKKKSSYPPKPAGEARVVKGLTLLSFTKSFTMVGTWCELPEDEI